MQETESRSVMSNSLNPMDYTAHGILQAGILEWVSFPFSRESSQPRDWTQVSHIAGRYFTSWATGKLKNTGVDSLSLLQGNLPSPGIKLVYRALQADSLPTELSGKPYVYYYLYYNTDVDNDVSGDILICSFLKLTWNSSRSHFCHYHKVC